jgi:hypothetical protein
VHGEPDAQDALAEGLEKRGAEKVEIPERGQTFEV